MSNFACEHCGSVITDTAGGYITGCEHYPIEQRDNVKRGMRFVDRAGDFNWRHRLEMLPGDIDCTDMGDEQFSAQVMTHNGEVRGASVTAQPACEASSAEGATSTVVLEGGATGGND